MKALHAVNVAPVVVREASGFESSDAAEIFSADVIVDAVLGTGFRPPVSPLYAAAIAKMNARRLRLLPWIFLPAQMPMPCRRQPLAIRRVPMPS